MSARKRCDIVISTSSLTAYLLGALKVDFDNVKIQLKREHPLMAANPSTFLDEIIEELFRYLYILSLHSASSEVVEVSPSALVDKAFHCLLLNPVLYFKVCDEILSLQDKMTDKYPIRVLPHNPLGGDDM